MAQPQSQTPQSAFSPPLQHSPSPTTSQMPFAPPPNKRVQGDGTPSQPESPYANSPYTMSPVPAAATPGSAGSPPNAPSPALPVQPAPYTNGTSTPTLNLPDTRPSPTPPVQTPQSPSAQTPQYTNAAMVPMSPAPPVQAPGAMGPPQRPAERPTKDYEYDVTDSLAGTGIDLRAEEQYMSDMYSTYFDPEARSGFPQHPAGGKSSFYGAGPANQQAQTIAERDQNKQAAQAAEKAWTESAMRIGAQRTQEINDPFLLVALLHRRAEKIAGEHHLSLNLDLKNNNQSMGKMKLPNQFNEPSVTVNMKQAGPNETMVQTTGSFIPHDAYLVDQLALMSIATKTRLRDLVDDASAVATHRQKTSHGESPDEWAAAAAPLNVAVPERMDVDGLAADGTPAPGPNPLKRASPLHSAAGSRLNIATGAGEDGGMPPKKLAKISSYMTTTMRDLAKQEREWEEARLRKRQKRKDGIPDSGSTISRAGSVAPGTPGSVAPEPEKASTKKESKKAQAAKTAEANNHANQNITSSMFAGLGGKGSLFGKKKTGKTYDWMNVGRGGSGTSTPSRATSGSGKGAGGGPNGTPGASTMALTTEGRNRLGTWREDKEKGKNIQLRDWISVLERDGREAAALQRAYIHLDASNPK